MDSTAFSLCMDNKIPIVVFDMNTAEQFHRHRSRAKRSGRSCPRLTYFVIANLAAGTLLLLANFYTHDR